MQILDLFSGIGGFSLGFESANFKNYDFLKLPAEQESVNDGFFKTAAFCEIDINCHKVLKKHWADVPIFHDVTKITSDDLAPLGKIDIITGGFPCQDLSLAGKRVGLSGSRSGLFSEILRLARITDAGFILFENSGELITNKAYFKVFAAELRECGYEYRAFLLRASAFGYLHERKRAYVIAYSDKIRRFCDETLFYEVSNANTQKPSKEIIRICDRYFWREANGYKNDLRDIRKDDGFCQNVERIGMIGNSVVPEIVAKFARFIKRIKMNYEAVFFIMIENMKKMEFHGFISWLCFVFVVWIFLMAFGIELSKGLDLKKSVLDLYDSIILIALLVVWVCGIYCYGKFRIV